MSQSNIRSDVEQLCDFLSANPCLQCRRCGSVMVQVKTTFSTIEPNGKAWDIAMPFCPNCDLGPEAARFLLMDDIQRRRCELE